MKLRLQEVDQYTPGFTNYVKNQYLNSGLDGLDFNHKDVQSHKRKMAKMS